MSLKWSKSIRIHDEYIVYYVYKVIIYIYITKNSIYTYIVFEACVQYMRVHVKEKEKK